MKNFLFAAFFSLFAALLAAQSPELRIPTAHACADFSFSKDDKTAITIGQNEVKIWDMSGPFLLKTLVWIGLDTLYAKDVFFTPDQQRAIIHANDNIRFINLRSLEFENTRFKIPEAGSMALSPDGKTLISFLFGEKGTLQKTDVATGKTTKLADVTLKDREFPDGIGASIDVEISPDGSKVLCNGFERNGILFDAATGRVLKKFNAPWPLFFLPNGNILTSTYLDYDRETVTQPNPRYLIEEVETTNFKTLRKTNFTFKTDDLGEDYGTIVHISHDHLNRVLYSCNGKFHVFEAKNWAMSSRRGFEKDGNFAMTNGGKSMFSAANLLTASLETGRISKKMGFFPYSPFNLAQATIGTDRGILVGYKHLHFDEKGFRISILPILEGCDGYNYLQRSIYRVWPEKKTILMVSGGGLNNYQLKKYDLQKLGPNVSDIEIDPEIGRSAMEMRTSADGTFLATDSDRMFWMDGKTWKPKREIIFGGEWRISHFLRGDESYVMERSPDGKRAIIHLKNESGEEPASGTDSDRNGSPQADRIACYDLATGSLVWKYDEKKEFGNAIFAEGGNQIWLIGDGGELIKLDAKTGKLISKSPKIPYANFNSRISPSSKYITNFISSDESIFGTNILNVVDAATLNLKMAAPPQRAAYTGSMFYDNDRFFITYEEDLKIWETATGKLIARIILIEDGADWIVSAPDGRFDGSPGGMKQMYFVKGREMIPLEQLYEGFYTPNLLQELMYPTEESKSWKPAVDLNKLKLPPTVRLVNKSTGLRNLEVVEETVPNYISDTKTVLLSLEADGKDSEIAEMQLFHNGKLISVGTRNLSVADENESKMQRDFEVALVAGENRFRAVAINIQRTESRPEEITVQFKLPPAEEKKVKPGITLHLLVVGINAYKNPKYTLNYAEADATSLRDAMKTNCGSVVATCREHFILNDKAVKANITAALETVAAEAKPEDVFILYYAGHGVMDASRAFFLVPHDVTQLYGNDGALAQKGISATDLKAFSTKIKAQKQVFILDACQSAGALEAFASRGAAEEKAIAQLARSTGTHWLTAAGSEQFASEFAQLGHGVFTFALLEGMKGGADMNGDGKITIKELDAFLQDQVPILTEKYRGTAQYPSSYGFGQDFPVGIIRK